MNLAVLDYRLHEEIFESYNYKLGYYDKSVPYYMIAHEGKMHHLEQNKVDLNYFVGEWKQIRDGVDRGVVVDTIKPPRNAVNIFWEYAKKEVGQ